MDREPEDLMAVHRPAQVDTPPCVRCLAGDREATFVWRNELGGLAFRIDDVFVKWNPRGNSIDLALERKRLEWLRLRSRHPAPQVVGYGDDETGSWLVTEALAGDSAVADVWRADPTVAVAAIANGLRRLHTTPADLFPRDWVHESWVWRAVSEIGPRPPVDNEVLVHGDACAPNTLIDRDGHWAGHVDLGALTVGDRWADLAVASMSLDWNYGEGHQDEFFACYGIDPDPVRIGYYRALWDIAS